MSRSNQTVGISDLPLQLNPKELIGIAHPRNKIQTSPNKTKSKKGRRGRPQTHGLSKRRIYVSHREAKRRCSDTKHPDFSNYGGRGIEYRFKSVADLFNLIGDRPAGCSLDRIDPNGHYEAGNVRWATPKEQACNRRPANPYKKAAQDRSWYQASEEREAYKIAAKHWLLSIRCLNDPKDLDPAEVSFLEKQHHRTEIPHATFWNRPTGDCHFVGLPALNGSGSCVVRVGAFIRSEKSSLSESGLLEGTVDLSLKVNCSAEEISIINSFVRGNRDRRGTSGLVYSGDIRINSNRIEGRLLAVAGRLRAYQLSSRVLLASEVAGHLAANMAQSLLAPEYLFLPDLNVWPEIYGSDRSLTYRLSEVLVEREQRGLPTLAYIENFLKLGYRFVSLFEERYGRADLSKVRPFHHLTTNE